MRGILRDLVAVRLSLIVVAWLLTAPRSGAGQEREAQPSTTTVASGDPAEVPFLHQLSAPYWLLSLRSVDRTLEVITALLEPIRRDDVLTAMLDEIQEGGVNSRDLPGVNTGRPVGYLLTLPSDAMLMLSAAVNVPEAAAAVSDAADTTTPDEVAQVEYSVVEVDADGRSTTRFVPAPAIEVETESNVWETILADPAVLICASITDRRTAKDLLQTTMTPDTSLRPVQGSTELFQAVSEKSDEVGFALRLVGDDVLPQELIHREPVRVRQRHTLQIRSSLRVEQPQAIGVVVGQLPADAALDGSQPPLNGVPLPQQLPMLPQPGRRTVRGGNHVHRQELGQRLSIEFVASRGSTRLSPAASWDGPATLAARSAR